MKRLPVPFAIVAVLLAGVAAAPEVSAVPGVRTQGVDVPCTGGRVTVGLATGSLPGGRWSAEDACIPSEAFYEVNIAEHRLVLALTVVDYGDGRIGRLAVATLTTPEAFAVSLVGVEDEATGFVRWAYAEGTHSGSDGVLGFAGSGLTDVADEPAEVELTITGIGTDLLTADNEVAEDIRTVLFDAVERLTG
jgi:hypothetical protein